MTRTTRRRFAAGSALTLSLATSAAMAVPSAASAAAPAAAPTPQAAVAAPTFVATIDSHSPAAFDVDTPRYIGYDSTVRAYRFRVHGRWRAACSNSTYCYPKYAGYYPDMGVDDMVKIKFSAPVQVKKQRIRSYDACYVTTRDKTSTSGSGSFNTFWGAVSDRVYEGYRKWNVQGSSGETGSCKRSAEPTATIYGRGSVTLWSNMASVFYDYDVWVNPLPSNGNCYDRVYVKGLFTHTWNTQALSFSLGYPFGVGVGVSSGSGQVTVSQDTDGYRDADLVSPKMCKH